MSKLGHLPRLPVFSTTVTIFSSVSIFNLAPWPVDRIAKLMSSFRLTVISLAGPVFGGDFGLVEDRMREDAARPEEIELQKGHEPYHREVIYVA